MGQLCFAINGYGVGGDACSDLQYARYLSPIMQQISLACGDESHAVIYLMGGATNNASVTEAQYMREWFYHHARDLRATFVLIEPKTAARGAHDNLVMLQKHCGDHAVWIYCLDAREWKMRFLVRRLLPRATVCGVDFARFDSHKAAIAKQIAWFVADVIEVAGHKLPPLGWVSKKLRLQHIKAASKKGEHEPK